MNRILEDKQQNMPATPFQDVANIAEWRARRCLFGGAKENRASSGQENRSVNWIQENRDGGWGQENRGIGWGRMDGLVSGVEKVAVKNGAGNGNGGCWNSDEGFCKKGWNGEDNNKGWEDNFLLGSNLLEELGIGAPVTELGFGAPVTAQRRRQESGRTTGSCGSQGSCGSSSCSGSGCEHQGPDLLDSLIQESEGKEKGWGRWEPALEDLLMPRWGDGDEGTVINEWTSGVSGWGGINGVNARTNGMPEMSRPPPDHRPPNLDRPSNLVENEPSRFGGLMESDQSRLATLMDNEPSRMTTLMDNEPPRLMSIIDNEPPRLSNLMEKEQRPPNVLELNLLNLLDQQDKSMMPSPPPAGRPITASRPLTSLPPPPPPPPLPLASMDQFQNAYGHLPHDQVMSMLGDLPPGLPPINVKVPPPGHPPAVPPPSGRFMDGFDPSLLPPPEYLRNMPAPPLLPPFLPPGLPFPPPDPMVAPWLRGPPPRRASPPPARRAARSGPAMELHLRLEQGYDQFKNLEKERKKTEAALARQNPGKKLNSTNHHPIPRLPPNPTRVDKLVIDSLREHARVVTLISRMERLRGLPLNPGIHVTMQGWVDKVMAVQDRRREEIVNQRDKDVLALAEAIACLAEATRMARTSLWCALQATVLREMDDDLPTTKPKTMDSTTLPVSLAAVVDTPPNNEKKMMKLEENKDALEELLLKM